MAHALHDMRLVDVSLGIGLLQRVHLEAALTVEAVAVVGCIVAATPNHKRSIAQIEQRHIAGMASHHRSGSPCISQTTIGLIICTNPLRNSTATVITRRSRTVGLNTRLWEAVTLQTELNSMGTVAWYYEDNLWIA